MLKKLSVLMAAFFAAALSCAALFTASAENAYISGISLAKGGDAEKKLEDSGFGTVMTWNLNPGSEADGRVLLGYNTGGTPITGIIVTPNNGNTIKDKNNVSYSLASTVGVSGGACFYVTTDKKAGDPIVSLDIARCDNQSDDAIDAIAGNGSETVRDVNGKPADLGSGSDRYTIYMRVVRSSVVKPFIGELSAVTGSDREDAVYQAASKGFDYFAEGDLLADDNQYTVFAYNCTRDAEKAIRCVAALRTSDAKSKSVKINGVTYKKASGTVKDKKTPYNDSGRIVIDQNTTMSPEVFEANFQSNQSNYHYMNNTAVPRAQAEFEDGYDLAMANADKARMWEYIGAGVSIGFGLMAIAGGIMKIIDLANYYEPEYDEIQRYIVDEKDITKEDENGNTIVLHNDFAYYKVVTCNRKAKGTSGDSNHNWWTSGAKTNVDKYTQWGCGDYDDLNGDVGKGWLALYTETNPEHDPIEAGTFVVKFNDEVPSGYDNAIHLFGSSAAVNLNSSRWDFNADTTYVYYKTDHIHTFTHGDVNNDGMIDIKDATEIQRYAAQFIELDSTALAAADVSGDGNVTIADATKIQRYIAKLINELVTVST